jgi:hypothetical protein
MPIREEVYLQALVLPSHFWLLLLASYFCPFVSSTFSLASFFFQVEEKKNTKKKKTIEKKKNAGKGGSLPFFSRFCIWDEAFLLPFSSPHSFNVELSTFLKPYVPCLFETLCYSSSGDGSEQEMR